MKKYIAFTMTKDQWTEAFHKMTEKDRQSVLELGLNYENNNKGELCATIGTKNESLIERICAAYRKTL